MASSSQLSECVARQLGLPEATIALHLRNIREAGFITQGGRGRSSARMTPADAAHLLIASVGSLHPKDSVEVVGKYGPTEKTKYSRWDVGLVPKLDKLPKKHTFAEAMTALIEGAIANDIPIKNTEKLGFEAILITLFWPWDGAKIEFYKYDEAAAVRDTPKYIMTPAEPYWLVYGEGLFKAPAMPPISTVSKADFQQERKFTHRTIFALAKLLEDS